jgi:hypothetical protein
MTERKLADTIRARGKQWAEENAHRFPPDYDENSEHVKHAIAAGYEAGARDERRRARRASM